MNKRAVIYTGVAVAIIVFVMGVRLAIRAHQNLVTLDVRNVELRDVLKEIQWQTWEVIYTHKDVNGKITLKVVDMPLEEVMEKIAEQTASKFNVLYPIYKRGESVIKLRKVLRGEISPQEGGWTNLLTRPFRVPGMIFASSAGANLKEVNLTIAEKDADIAALALSRYEPARVVIEDGITGKVNLIVTQTPFEKVVDKFAKQLKLNWTKLYTLQPGIGIGRRFARFNQFQDTQNNTNQPPSQPPFFTEFQNRRDANLSNNVAAVDTNAFDSMSNSMAVARQEFQRQLERQMEILSPQERQQMEEMRQRFEQLRQLPPEQRRAQFEQLANDPQFRQQMQQRILDRMYTAIRDLTPEQRAEREREMRQMRQRFGSGAPPR